MKITEIINEDYSPNVATGPEFKPTMPAGTVRVDVSDVYDWYKLGKDISNLKRANASDFGKGPPSTIMAFGSEPEEHKYIAALKKLGLTTTDIDPLDPNQPKSIPRQKVDHTYNVDEDWNKVNHHDKTNGLSQKAVNAYRREHPGSKLQTAVTTKPSKLKPGSKAAKRRKSFCARMSGNKGPMKKPNGKPTPKALALRRWNCESIEEMQQLIQRAEQVLAEEKQRLDPKCWKGKHKEGTKIKGGVRVNNCVPNESVEEAANAAQQAAIAVNMKKQHKKPKNASK